MLRMSFWDSTPAARAARGSFGWSVCTEDDRGILQPPLKAQKGLATDAQDAIDKVKTALKAPDFSTNPNVLAAGIDAPLFWSSGGITEIDYKLDQAMRCTEPGDEVY